MKIKIKEDDYLNYHIKTHQDGSNVRCTSKKITDIKELFIYKLLHSIEILPEVHYYYYSINNVVQFCIATMDVKDYSRLNFKNKHLSILLRNDEIDRYIFEREDFTYNLTFVDILSRIFLLSDCLTNDGNFGIVANGDSLKLYIFDFQVGEVGTFYGYKTNPVFDQFCSGNTRYNYTNFCEKVLRDRDVKLRINDAKLVMKNLENFLNILKDCYYEIHNYFLSSDSLKSYEFKDRYDLTISKFNSDPDQKAYGDFNVYVMHVKENFTQFSLDLESRLAELN